MLVTCVVPVWNGETYLAQALASIFAQSYRGFEVIIVDDGSTDRTAAIIAEQTHKLQLIRQENAGPAVSRNRGIAAASGDLIAFLDHDDLWEPRKLERQVAAFASTPGLAACTGLVREFIEDEFASHAAVVGNISSAIMISRQAINLIGPLNQNLNHADIPEWLLRARAAGCREAVLPEVVTLRRRHAGNRSQFHNARARREYLGVLKANLDRNRQAAS
jgi:glycosyltransferase involved in cell wall biosynthesis